MSVLSFTVFCIEHYAEDRGLTGPAVYAQFKREGLLAHLRTEYEDLHGMGKEFLMRYFDSFLGVGKTRLLFHGSTVEVREPMILHGDMGREFGAGFYITSHREQATRWAKREVRLLRKNGNPGARAIVNGYGDQIAFCSHRALASLRFLDAIEVEV